MAPAEVDALRAAASSAGLTAAGDDRAPRALLAARVEIDGLGPLHLTAEQAEATPTRSRTSSSAADGVVASSERTAVSRLGDLLGLDAEGEAPRGDPRATRSPRPWACRRRARAPTRSRRWRRPSPRASRGASARPGRARGRRATRRPPPATSRRTRSSKTSRRRPSLRRGRRCRSPARPRRPSPAPRPRCPCSRRSPSRSSRFPTRRTLRCPSSSRSPSCRRLRRPSRPRSCCRSSHRSSPRAAMSFVPSGVPSATVGPSHPLPATHIAVEHEVFVLSLPLADVVEGGLVLVDEPEGRPRSSP